LLRTNGCLTLSIFFCLIFIYPSLSRAETSSSQDQSEKTEAVNQQLNRVENEFSNARADEVKESPNVHPDRQSTGVMLKDFLSPDLYQNVQPKIPSNVKTRVHSVDLGAEFLYYRYQEPKPVGVTLWGPMYGFYAKYAYRPAPHNILNNFLTNAYFLQARYATSRDLEYKGSGIIKGEHDEAMEFRGLIGKDYFIGRDSRVTPYFGFGYRYLIDHGNGRVTSTDFHGYDRKSHYYYLPLGGDVAIEMPKNWEIDFNAEYDILLHGMQKSFLSDVNRFDTDFTNSQDKGFGLRASVKILKHGSIVDYYMEPYIRYWNIEESKPKPGVDEGTIQTLVEPKNNTTEIGSKFGIQF
jgi:hypothetical protein